MDPNTDTVRKPNVGGTKNPVTDSGAVSGMDCAKVGGTAFGVGVALMATWKLMSKWF